ncbi:MAG: hypothetical protein IT236_04015 [Bacteroidia bacterium]|nr:hypothetical protein [Bacteroidia bacterium]
MDDLTALNFKESLRTACHQQLQTKLQTLALALSEITESINTETKSSVGDKHETARARMQFEQDKLNGQIAELKLMQAELEKSGSLAASDTVGTNSLVTTSAGTFYIVVAIGKLIINDKEVYVISPASPLAKAMKGLGNQDEFTFNKLSYKIKSIH